MLDATKNATLRDLAKSMVELQAKELQYLHQVSSAARPPRVPLVTGWRGSTAVTGSIGTRARLVCDPWSA